MQTQTLEMPTLPASHARLDEQALRRPGFLGGRPVTLADGQEWYVPVPEIFLCVSKVSTDGFGFDFAFGGVPDAVFTQLIREFEIAEGLESIRAEMRMIAYAFDLNYSLDDEQAAQILRFPVGPGVESPARTAIRAALTGTEDPNSGKLSGTGSSELL
jgi:hypothetical protein